MQHLLDLPNAKTQLTLWKADLSDEGSYEDAINGCDGVFHVATPMDFESTDPEVSYTFSHVSLRFNPTKKLFGFSY